MELDPNSFDRAKDTVYVDSQFRFTATNRTSDGAFVVVISGDLDAPDAELLNRVVTAGMTSGAPTTLRMDGVGVFGSAAARAIGALLQNATDQQADLEIAGIPRHVGSILQLVGLNDRRLHLAGGPSTEIPPAVFDAVMAAGTIRAREPICITTYEPEDPKILFANRALCDQTGYDASELIGRNPRMFQGPLTDRGVIDQLKDCLRNGRSFSGEAVNYRKDGRPYWLNWVVFPIHHGAQRYLMALQRDVTSHRRLARMQAARNQLEALSHPHRNDDNVVLETLARAVATVLVSAHAPIATVLTDSMNDVVAANLEGSVTDTQWFTDDPYQLFEADGTVTIHHPFPLNDSRTGHLLVQGLHSDWLRLLDLDQLAELCTLGTDHFAPPRIDRD